MNNAPNDGEQDATVAAWRGQSLGLPKDGIGSLAPPMSRFGARLTDGLIFIALYLLTVLLRFAVTRELTWANPRPLQVAFAAAGLVYEITMIALWGQTLGKMFAGIKVVTAEGMELPGWGRSLRRSILFDGSTFSETLIGTQLAENVSAGVMLVDVLWILRDRNRQALHDKMAGTIVVRERRAVELEARTRTARS